MFECIGRGGALGVQELNSATPLIQRQPRRLPMESMYYIGLDVHKKLISYCVKDASGRIPDKVARFVAKRTGKNAFYYPRTQRDYDFSRAIDKALESAECIVAVGSRLENLMARWPEYEYRTFNLDVNSGKKPNGKLLSLVVGIDPMNLPLPLRRFVVISCASEAELPDALEQLVRYIG
jgi:hypothetical protein